MRNHVLRAAALALCAMLVREIVVALPAVGANDAAPALDAWSADLRSTDLARRRAAAEEASFFRSDRRAAMPALAEALGDPDPVVRRLVAKSLADLASPADAPLATRLTAAAATEKEAYVRLQITRALVAIGVSDPVVKRALEERRRDPDPKVAQAATTALGGDAAPKSPMSSAATPRSGMSLALGAEPRAPDPAWSKRLQEMDALVKRGPAAAPELVRLLTDPDHRVRGRALAQLKALGPEAASAAPDLLPALASSDGMTRQVAVDVLRAMGPGAAVVAPRVIGLLDDPKAQVRRTAAEALAALGPAASSAVPRLGAALGDSDAVTAGTAARVLGAIGSAAAPAIPALATAAGTGEDLARVLPAIQALGTLGPAAAPAAPALRARLRARNATVAVAAARALWAIEGNSSLTLPVLVAALNSSTPGLAREAARGLGELGAAAEPATPALLDALDNDGIRDLRSSAYGALRKIGEPALPYLLLAVSDPDSRRARSATSLLREIEQMPSQ